MLRWAIFLAALVIVAARRSPNHEYIEELIAKTPVGAVTPKILLQALMDVPDLIKYNGYPAEVHQVVTTDGYILEAHRIPHGIGDSPSKNKPIAFLMHGLTSSSADFLLMGPERSLGYLLADEGYDVWLGNARGNYYSRRHVSLNPDSDDDFWKYSWDEIGNLDLPAFIDHILKTTGQTKLHYIGHSQGGTTFLVLTSLRPEYNEKIASFQGLAPASYFTHNESPLFAALAPFESILENAGFKLGIREVVPRKCIKRDTSFGAQVEYLVCKLIKPDTDKADDDHKTLIQGHTPAGASIRQFRHYGQSIRFNTFRRLSLDPLTNLRRYGSLTPPDYDVTKITVPSFLHYGLEDIEVNHNDVKTLASKLPNAELNEMADPHFNHVDFLWHKDVVELLFKTMFKTMRRFNEIDI